MASQLAIEITLEQASGCLFVPSRNIATATTNVVATQNLGWKTTALPTGPMYSVGNVNLIPEILQFDASYGNLKNNYRCHVFKRPERRWSVRRLY